MKPKRLQILLLVLILAVPLSGCDNPALDRRITAFDTALIKSSDSIRTYYEQINDLERTSYFDKLRFEPTIDMAETEDVTEGTPEIKTPAEVSQKKDDTDPPDTAAQADKRKQLLKAEYATGLLTKFNPADIEVRIAAVETLGKFGEGLAALSGSDAAARAGKSVEEIGDDVQSISAHIAGLKGQKSPEFASFAGPISTIGSIVTTHWFKAKQNDSVRKSIVESKEPVLALIKKLKVELNRLDKTVLQLSAEQSLQYRIDYYNKVYVKKTAVGTEVDAMIEDGKRKAFLVETQTYAIRIAHVKAVAPVALVSALEDSYNKLLKTAELKPSLFDLFKDKDKQAKDEDFRDLTQSIGAFLEEAKRLEGAVAELKKISHEHT